MSPEDRSFITTSIANLWTFQAGFMARVLLELRREDALSAESAERLLQELDRDCEALEGDDERMFATGAIASARSVLAAHGYGPDQRRG